MALRERSHFYQGAASMHKAVVLRLLVLKAKSKITVLVDDCKTSTVGSLLRVCADHFGYASKQLRALFKDKCLNSKNTLEQEGVCGGDLIVVAYIDTGDLASVYKADRDGFCVRHCGTIHFGQPFLAKTVDLPNESENETETIPAGVRLMHTTADSDAGHASDTCTMFGQIVKIKPSRSRERRDGNNEGKNAVISRMKNKFLKQARRLRQRNKIKQSKIIPEGRVSPTFKSDDVQREDGVCLRNQSLKRIENTQQYEAVVEVVELVGIQHPVDDISDCTSMSICLDDVEQETSSDDGISFSDDDNCFYDLLVAQPTDSEMSVSANLNDLNCLNKSNVSKSRKSKAETFNTHHFHYKSATQSSYKQNNDRMEYRSMTDTLNCRDRDSGFSGYETEVNMQRSVNRRLNKKKSYRAETDLWIMTLDRADENEAQRLLQRKLLPNYNEVTKACRIFGRRSRIFSEICDNICNHLKKKSKDIFEIWPAYEYTPGAFNGPQLVFVVCTKEGTIEADFDEFHVFQRSIADYSSESKIVLNKEVKEKVDITLMKKLQQSIANNSPSLMAKHSNINMVSASFFKSVGFGFDNHKFLNAPCIAIYVHIKGLIPVKEDPFPPKIDGFPVDVREAGFNPFTGGPKEFHESLKMGCAIHAGVLNKEGELMGGSLGAFLYHPVHGKCCLTCAHVVLSANDMIAIRDGNGGTAIFGPEYHKPVYQPVCEGSRPFGRIVCAFFKEGDDGKSGVDAALIQMTDRFPVCGNFPKAENYSETGKPVSTGTTQWFLNQEKDLTNEYISSEVFKFGAITEITRGIVRMNGSFIRKTNMYGRSQFGYLLNNQVEILSIGSIPFAECGDSGALVFAKDRSNELVAVGMLEGGMTDGRVMITPIMEILREIKGITGHEPDSQPKGCPSFYLQLQPNREPILTSDDSGIHMDVDGGSASSDETRPKQLSENFDFKAAIQALQADNVHLKAKLNKVHEMLQNICVQNTQRTTSYLPFPGHHSNF